jgi:hypothetical protein
MNYPAFKIIENHKGVAFVKNAPAFAAVPLPGQKAELPT